MRVCGFDPTLFLDEFGYPAVAYGPAFSAADEEIDFAVKVSQTVVPLGFGYSEPLRLTCSNPSKCAILDAANWLTGASLSTDRNSERRPDPDALLALAEKGKRGRLLVFFGAAPGVGKTFAMLRPRARERAGASTSSSASSRPTAATTRKRSCAGSRSCRGATSTIGRAARGVRSRRGARAPARSSWSTSSPTPTRRDRATRSAGRTSKSCSPRASTSTRRSTSSTSRA